MTKILRKLGQKIAGLKSTWRKKKLNRLISILCQTTAPADKPERLYVCLALLGSLHSILTLSQPKQLYSVWVIKLINPFMAEFPGRLHKPLQIPQYNTTCAINYLETT